jgi:hypothetical protein
MSGIKGGPRTATTPISTKIWAIILGATILVVGIGVGGYLVTQQDLVPDNGVAATTAGGIAPTSWGEGSEARFVVDTFNNSYRLYNCRNASTMYINSNKTKVLAYVAANGTANDVVVVEHGILGVEQATCVIGVASESLAAGQIVYKVYATAKYALADASANSTVGYGYVWLNTLIVAGDAQTLLMEQGSFILSTYSFTQGESQWVSTAAGGIIDIDAAAALATGEQLCQVGIALSTTELKFVNPNGDYGEHV